MRSASRRLGRGVARRPLPLRVRSSLTLRSLALLMSAACSFAFAAIVGRLLFALADDAVEYGLTHGRRVVGPPQPHVHDLNALLFQGRLLQRLTRLPPAVCFLSCSRLSSTRPGSVLISSSSSILPTTAPSSLLMRWPSTDRAPSIAPTLRMKRSTAGGVGDAPADVGVDGQRLVDGVALGVAGEQFRPRQVEILQTAVEALNRLDRPGQAKVQTGLRVVGAVVGGHVAAELRQIDEFGAVHGERPTGRPRRPPTAAGIQK